MDLATGISAIIISVINTLVIIVTISRKMVTKEDIAELNKEIADIKAGSSVTAQDVAVLKWRVGAIEKKSGVSCTEV